MKFEVEWSEAAEADLEGILGLISVERPRAAREIAHRLRRLAGSLETFSRRGRLVPELRALGLTAFRELIAAPWRMIYRLQRPRVLILALFDGRRDLEEILLERVLRQR